jgi:hypothetical protein
LWELKNNLMRKQIIFTTISFLLAAMSFGGCKKDNNNKAPDPSAAIKNTVWTGEVNYPGKAVEPISITLVDDGTLKLYELSGEYNGSWKLENGQLSISIAGTVSFKANISSDSTLTNIQNSDISGRVLNNATLNRSGDPVLDNTAWTAPNLVIKFKPGLTLDMQLGVFTNYANLSYVRKGKSIRFVATSSYKWFLVTNSGSSMKGANSFDTDPTVYPFVATKE